MLLLFFFLSSLILFPILFSLEGLSCILKLSHSLCRCCGNGCGSVLRSGFMPAYEPKKKKKIQKKNRRNNYSSSPSMPSRAGFFLVVGGLIRQKKKKKKKKKIADSRTLQPHPLSLNPIFSRVVLPTPPLFPSDLSADSTTISTQPLG
eukprot:TRINITY_DN5294_c0_g2_i1.p1 TRINITY_DN5294_c0_g2~~TRINITY_DN5294_c0_g2_i1.p1  ORF type:complete len:148 (+),score=6.53 TRINITY_DN5294_c0_g2_i1:532-975(+)